MKHIIESVRKAIEHENWIAAVALALTIPDVGRELDGRQRGRRGYIEWFEANGSIEYIVATPGTPTARMQGADCYALRCAYLHSGEVDLTTQEVQEVLERVRFLVPDQGGWTMQELEGVLMATPAQFCEALCAMGERWLTTVATNTDVQERIDRMPLIERVFAGTLDIGQLRVRHDPRTHTKA